MRLWENGVLRLPDPDDPDVDDIIGWGRNDQRAHEGDRTAALGKWKELASGRISMSTLLWLQGVAEDVLCADTCDKKARPNELVKAIRLSGRVDRHRELREQWKDDVIRDDLSPPEIAKRYEKQLENIEGDLAAFVRRQLKRRTD